MFIFKLKFSMMRIFFFILLVCLIKLTGAEKLFSLVKKFMDIDANKDNLIILSELKVAYKNTLRDHQVWF